MFNFIQQLFKKQETSNVPFVQEIIVRSDEEQAAYQYWKLEDQKDHLLDFLATQMKSSDQSILLKLNSPKSQGFILKYKTVEDHTSFEAFRHLFDYLKEQTLQLNYVKYMSDVKNFVRKTHVETIERHYLKPRFSFDEQTGLADQQYGNVLIEHLLHNEKSIQIKFVCNVYNDRKWTKVLSFEDLMKKILL
ncbi:MAG: hypothetical protein R3E32_20895 [Chitinophagales bacterium]